MHLSSKAFHLFAPIKMMLAAFGLSLLACGQIHAQTLPEALFKDPPADLKKPARFAAVSIPSHGVTLDARLYVASGAGPHPTLLMLDGLPGWHNSSDIGMAVRRAGWNVMTLHYRGIWGQPGRFSIRHSMEDTASAVAFLRTPEVVAKFGIDTHKLVVAGHSMGGFCALALARKDHQLAGTILIDAEDVGSDGRALRESPKFLKEYVDAIDDIGHSTGRVTALDIAKETASFNAEWDYVNWADALAGHPILIFGTEGESGNGKESQALADAIGKKDGSKMKLIMMATDHSFSDHRIELTVAILNWLATLEPAS